MKTIYNDVEYKEGDKIEFSPYGVDAEARLIGTVIFGRYDDREAYYNDHHLGFYVEYSHNVLGNERTDFETLPDCIDYLNGIKRDTQ